MARPKAYFLIFLCQAIYITSSERMFVVNNIKLLESCFKGNNVEKKTVTNIREYENILIEY